MWGKLGEHTTMPPQLVMCHVYLVLDYWITYNQMAYLHSAVTAQKNKDQRVARKRR